MTLHRRGLFFVFQSLLRRNQIQSVEFGLQLVGNNVASDMKDIIYFSRWCTTSNDILKYLETFHGKAPLAIVSKDDKTLRSIALSSSDRLKEEYRNTNRHISRAIVSTSSASNYLQVLSGAGDTHSYTVASLADSEIFKTLLASPEILWTGIINDPFYRNFQEAPVIPIVRPVYNTYGTKAIGWVYVSVSTTVITDYLKSFPLPDDSRLYFTMGEKFYRIQGEHFEEIPPDFTILSQEKVPGVDAGTLVQKDRNSHHPLSGTGRLVSSPDSVQAAADKAETDLPAAHRRHLCCYSVSGDVYGPVFKPYHQPACSQDPEKNR